MNGRRAFVALAVAALVLAAGAASPADPPAGRGRLPAEALDLPADARFVLGLDVPRFVASPLYRSHGQGPGSAARLQAFDDLRRVAGIDPERDLSRIIVAGFAPPRREGVALAFGAFDGARLDQALTSAPVRGARGQIGETVVYRLEDPRRGPNAVAILGPGCLLLGTAKVVEEMVSRHGQRAFAGNAGLLGLIERLDGDPTFWLASDDSLLGQLGSRPSGGAAAMPLGLPALRHLLVWGTLEPQVSLDVIATAADDLAARNLADMVRGFVALMAFQAQQRPALAGLAQAVAVEVQGREVRLRCRLTQEQTAALLASAAAGARPSSGSTATPAADSRPPAPPATP
jgi:hypothetical protein